MAVNATELIHSSVESEVVRNVLEIESDDFKQKLYNAIINMLGSFNTKTVALEKLNMMLTHEKPCELLSVASKLFSALIKILHKSSESSVNRRLASSCLSRIIKVSVDGGDLQREVTSAVPSIVGSLVNTDGEKSFVHLLSVIMRLFPGPCGPMRGQVWNKLTGLLGTRTVRREELGGLFVLYPQLGGGGRDGIEHTRAFSQCWQVVSNTLNGLLNNLFKYVKEFEKSILSRELISLNGVEGTNSFKDQVLRISQVSDLIEIECSLITGGFPQVREIQVEEILGQVGRLLSVSPKSIEQSDIPENRILSLLLPSLHVQALQLLQALMVSVEDELVPEAATINNILVKSFQISTSTKVREALYSTLSVYLDTVGASTGLEHCVDRIIPYLGEDMTPQQDKILLSGASKRQTGGGAGKKKKKNRKYVDDLVKSAKKETLVVPLCRAAIKFTGSLIENIGPLLTADSFRDLSCLLVNLALKNDIREPSILSSLFETLGLLSRTLNPGFNSPVRLVVHVLQAAVTNPNPDVVRSARQTLSTLNLALHPQCPSLHVPVFDETDMRKVVAKVISEAEDRREEADGKQVDSDNESFDTGLRLEVKRPELQSFLSSVRETSLDIVTKTSSEKIEPIVSSASKQTNISKQNEDKAKNDQSSREQSNSSAKAESMSSSVKKNVDPYSPRKERSEERNQKESNDLKRKLDADDETDLLENVDRLESNIKEMEERKRVRKESQEDSSKTEELDVSEMLKDFSDKLNENLLPDPWDSD